MNEQFKLNSKLVKAWLDKDDRKHRYLSKQLNISGSLVDKMLASGQVPNEATLNNLAALMGVEVSTLLLPRQATKAS